MRNKKIYVLIAAGILMLATVCGCKGNTGSSASVDVKLTDEDMELNATSSGYALETLFESGRADEVNAEIVEKINNKDIQEEVWQEGYVNDVPLAVVNLSVNPMASLYVTDANLIVGYTLDNEDSSTYYKDMDIIGRNYSDVVVDMLTVCGDNSLIEDNGTVYLTWEKAPLDVTTNTSAKALIMEMGKYMESEGINTDICVSDMDRNYSVDINSNELAECVASVEEQMQDSEYWYDGECPHCGGGGKVECPWCKGGSLMCDNCGGTGHYQKVCGVCNGEGISECPVCHGQPKACPKCEGDGIFDDKEIPYTCPECQGTGTHWVTPGPGSDGVSGSHWDTCDLCGGSGTMYHKPEFKTCEDCGGTGIEICKECGGKGGVTCPYCGGSGYEEDRECEVCLGTGYLKTVCPECDHSGYQTCDVCYGSGHYTGIWVPEN